MHCDQLQCQDMHRCIWVILNCKGKTLDVGSNEGSTWTMHPRPELDLHFMDCDVFDGPRLKPFIRADGHRLPFKNNSFDTVVYSDILEHAADPLKMLLEGKRVTRDLIVATVPDEWSWDASLTPRPHPTNEDHEVDPAFFDKWREKLDYVKMLDDISSSYARCTGVLREEKMHHFWHLRYFTLEKLRRLLDQVGMAYAGISHLHFHDRKFVHFAVLMRKTEPKL